MKEIIVATPKEEQFYEVIEFYGKDKTRYFFDRYGNESSIYIIDETIQFCEVSWFSENMPTAEIITFEQWRELVGKKENVSNELIQDIDLDIELLELSRKLVMAGRIKDGSVLSIIAGNSMKEKVNK